MRLLQRYLPSPKHVEVHRITVEAPPAAAWEAARHFDGASIPWVRLLFDLRGLPDRLRGRAVAADRRLGVDQVADGKSGFALLEERAGAEVVVGAIGQFWHLEIPFERVPPAAFASFDAPGWGKVAWAIRVERFGAGSQIVFELRTSATDEDSWRHLDRYYTLLSPASRLIRSSIMAHLEAQLGSLARPDDRRRELPGDELITAARYTLTHGVDIEAPPALVWPWLMQLGCDRGGWYSIDALDHGGVPSVEQPVPTWQTRAVGDRVAITPALDAFYDVLAVEPERLFAVGGEAARLGGHVKMAWSWILEPLGHDATHLVTRVRARGAPRWSEWLQGAVLFPPVHAIMQHAQLDHLRRLAEHQAQRRRG